MIDDLMDALALGAPVFVVAFVVIIIVHASVDYFMSKRGVPFIRSCAWTALIVAVVVSVFDMLFN